MAAYVIADLQEVTDPAGLEQYRTTVGAVIDKYDGKYLAAGGAVDRVEGDWKPGRLVIIEFPSIERLRAWYTSDDYRPLKELRMRSIRGSVALVAGL